MIITSYYPPEIGAASNRIYHLSEGLKQNYNVTVVTQLPNYPTGKIFKDYKKSFYLNLTKMALWLIDYGFIRVFQKIKLYGYLPCYLIVLVSFGFLYGIASLIK